jgi:DNA-binding transcriptional regulator/RsmH inhibitor MraZ
MEATERRKQVVDAIINLVETAQRAGVKELMLLGSSVWEAYPTDIDLATFTQQDDRSLKRKFKSQSQQQQARSYLRHRR